MPGISFIFSSIMTLTKVAPSAFEVIADLSPETSYRGGALLLFPLGRLEASD